jgi:hypothetical protein
VVVIPNLNIEDEEKGFVIGYRSDDRELIESYQLQSGVVKEDIS